MLTPIPGRLRVGAILSTIAAMVIGGAVAAVTVVGVVNSQTAGPDTSPGSVNSPVIDYGSND
jgi:hypothetical protein